MVNRLKALREENWRNIPASSGIYWWFFPESEIKDLKISTYCDPSDLRLEGVGGNVCLYLGIAKNLRQRIKWHASQKLRPSALQSGYLSTFRLSLLALKDYSYDEAGERKINDYYDQLGVRWEATESKEDARELELSYIDGKFDYPINIQDNRRESLARFLRFLKDRRKEYRACWKNR
jgi:hypothetical protein